MLGKHKLVVDTMSEVYTLLRPYADDEFWDLTQHTWIPGAVYVFGRQQFIENQAQIIEMANNGYCKIVFCNAAEGSWTLQSQLQMLKIESLVLENKILLISGGDQQQDYPYTQYDHFLVEILNYDINVNVANQSDAIRTTNKPYQYLFLNGRGRPHRKYLWTRLREKNLLDQGLWTMLDSRPSPNRAFDLKRDGVDLMRVVGELRWLPSEYEVDFYKNSTVAASPGDRTFVKPELFQHQWGEIYLQPEPYRDTYFSLVTETVFEQPWSFRTEKIAKPLMIGHPFIVAANPGYYRDLKNLGFQTFGHVIDESFDSIENHQDRMERILDIVQDLCSQNLDQFQQECYNVCKYNQQHLQEIAPSIKSAFVENFHNLLNQHE
jgi:hypothetical protein